MVSSSVAHGWRGGCFGCCLTVQARNQHLGTAGGRELLAEQRAVSEELRELRAETPRALPPTLQAQLEATGSEPYGLCDCPRPCLSSSPAPGVRFSESLSRLVEDGVMSCCSVAHALVVVMISLLFFTC